ncbi:MAG: RimK family alpha-L-glutamate ligase [Deltaproteobacteria bacterium]|nr:RimK family alpha-L-glutamate ligase [Deltaproteobacteria bacterium]
MRLWILSHLRDSPGGAFAAAAARRRGHEVESFCTGDLDLYLDAEAPRLLRAKGGGELTLPEVAFIRMGGSAPEAAYGVPWALQVAGVPCVNTVATSRTCRDKARTLTALSLAGVPIPRTVVPGGEARWEDFIARVPGPPWIVKPALGTQGLGVVLVESEEALEVSLAAYREAGLRVIVQEMVESSRGRDVRVLVLDGEARLAMQRKAAGGDFRSNLHQGGTGEPFELTPEIRRVAEAAARAVGAQVAGVDVLFGPEGPLVCEVNGSPGLRGIERATGVEASALVIEVLERAAARSAG